MTTILIRRTAKNESVWRRQLVPIRPRTVLLLILLPCVVALRLLLHIATDDAMNASTRLAVQTEEQITQQGTTVKRFIEVELPNQMSSNVRYKNMYRQNKNKNSKEIKMNDKQRDEDDNIIDSRDPCYGKEAFLPILQSALAHLIDDCPSSQDMQAAKQTLKGVSDIFGITTCNVRDLCSQLGKDTTWEQVVEQYYFKQRQTTDEGGQPNVNSIQVIGTRTCSAFRQGLLSKTSEGHILEPAVRAAGLFHSGLDIMAATLYANHFLQDDIEDDKSWQVPWGKHTPVQFTTSQIYKHQDWKSILPVVVVRDPYRWMNSLCKSRDGTVPWMGGKPLNCPSLVVPAKTEEKSTTNSTISDTQPNKVGIYWHPEEYPDAVSEEYNSLGDLWADWYNEYLLADFPRLLVRYEDLLFFPDQVMKVIAECIGKELTQPTRTMLHTDGDNGSEGMADLIHALAKHGTTKGRTSYQLSRQDLDYAQITMADLMDWFGYQTIVSYK